jgi:phosphatidylserine decarboxylase
MIKYWLNGGDHQRMRQYPIAREGWIFLAVLLILTLFVYLIAGKWTIAPAILLLFTAYFFRNPSRFSPEAEGIVVAPADGVVMKVENNYEDRYVQDETIKISIFLSLFNVHINRSPIDGTIEYIERMGGKFIRANHPQAGSLNAKNFLGLNSRWGKIMVVQITGLIARRIICWAEVGDEIKTGQRFGLIRFGSCTEIYLPKSVALDVKTGDKVKGGITVLGRFPD